MTVPCPCCGQPTLRERCRYEVCPECWWEDDGQDDPHADEVWGGPNADVSLTQARANYWAHGIYDLRRTDLLAITKSRMPALAGQRALGEGNHG